MKMVKLTAVLVATLLVATASSAQNKTTLRIVVAYPPGGSPDNTARVLAEKLQQSGAYTVIIDNKPGAAGSLAADVVKNASPDQFTVFLGDSSTYSITPNIRRNVTYDALRDFKPVGLAATSPIFLVVASGTAGTVKELIAKLKAQPGQLYGSSGNGTAHHLAMEMFKHLSGTDMGQVPYKGATLTVPAVASGEVVASFAGLTAANAFVQNGKIRILGIAEPRRSSMAPNIPTIAEAGVPGYGMTITLGFLAPLSTPDAQIKQLNAALVKATADPEVKAKLNLMGVEPASSTPEEFKQMIATELKTFGDIVKTANIKEE